MKKLVVIFCAFLILNACKKDDCPNLCLKDLKEDIVLDTHYNEIYCAGADGGYQWYYPSYEEYQNSSCSPNVPVEIGFNGIIIAQGVRVPFISESEDNSPAYAKSVEIRKDSCDKTIDFHFILKTESQFEEFEHNENVIVLLNGVDVSYTVNFSHEIIPFGE